MAKRVLLVDDNEQSLYLFSRYLRLCGLETVSADNGKEAWMILDRGESFDQIISDYSMPEMNGLELLRQVRGDGRTMSTPFALVSGDTVVSEHDQTPLERVASQHGATFWFRLNLDIDEMVERLGLICAEKH